MNYREAYLKQKELIELTLHANGGTRLTHNYWEKVEQLESELSALEAEEEIIKTTIKPSNLYPEPTAIDTEEEYEMVLCDRCKEEMNKFYHSLDPLFEGLETEAKRDELSQVTELHPCDLEQVMEAKEVKSYEKTEECPYYNTCENCGMVYYHNREYHLTSETLICLDCETKEQEKKEDYNLTVSDLSNCYKKAKERPKNSRQIERDMAVVYENFLKDNDITDPALGYIHDLYAKLWNCVIGPVYKPIYKHHIGSTTDFKVEADINTPFFGNSGTKIPMKEVKSELPSDEEIEKLQRILDDWMRDKFKEK